jgi:hypothetical protein
MTICFRNARAMMLRTAFSSSTIRQNASGRLRFYDAGRARNEIADSDLVAHLFTVEPYPRVSKARVASTLIR